MKSPGTYIEREPGSLKEAVTDLIETCGGSIEAAKVCRVEKSQLDRYSNERYGETHMPIDVVLSLEAHCHMPFVTRFLAFEAKQILLPIGHACSGTIADHMAIIGKDTGALYEQFGTSIKDGTIRPSEAARLRAAALQDIAALSALIGDLDHMREGRAA